MVVTRKLCGDSRARQAGVFQPPLDHAAHVAGGHGPVGERLRPADRGAEQRRVLGGIAQARGVEPGEEIALQVVADRDFAGLAALLLEAERVLAAVVVEILAAQPGDGPDARGGVDEDGDDGPVAQADDQRLRARLSPSAVFTGRATAIEASSVRACSTAISGVLPSTTL